MAFIADISNVGVLPFQEHIEKWGLSGFSNKNTVLTRGLLQGCRTTFDKDLGIPDIEEDTRGPWVGMFLWDTVSIAKHPPIWSAAMPVVSDKPPKECKRITGPARSISRSPPRTLPNKDKLQKWKPVFGPEWSDCQDDLKATSMVAPYSHVLPGGFPGIALDSVDTAEQHDLVFPAGNILVAPHRNGEGPEGTPVYDLDKEGFIDQQNWSHLQSFFRCWKRNFSRIFACDGPSSLAWQISDALPDIPGSGAVAQGPRDQQQLGFVTDEVGGPFHTVPVSDQHVFSSSFHSEPIAPLHFNVKSVFHGNGGDAPIEFGGEYDPFVSKGPLLVETYLRHDSEAQHTLPIGTFRGLWRLQTATFIAPIKDRVDPPEPKKPPKKPRVPSEPEGAFGGGSLVGVPGDLGLGVLPGGLIGSGTRTTDGGFIGLPFLDTPTRRVSGSSSTPTRVTNSAPTDGQLAGSVNELGVPGLVIRAQSFLVGSPDFRNMSGGEFEARRSNRTAWANQPAVLRIEGIAQQDGTGFTKTTKNNQSRYGSTIGTSDGGAWVMRPEQGIESITRVPSSVSTTYWGYHNVALAFGTPDTSTGGYTSGFDFSLSADDEIEVKHKDSSGSESPQRMTLDQDGFLIVARGVGIRGFNDEGTTIPGAIAQDDTGTTGDEVKIVKIDPSGGSSSGFPLIDIVDDASTQIPVGIPIDTSWSDAEVGRILTQGKIRVIVDSATTLAVGDKLYVQDNGTLDLTPAFEGQLSFVTVNEAIA